MNDYDVVIVGAGITGAAMALALADSGLRLALIDSKPLQGLQDTPVNDIADYDARVSAMTAASQRLLESLGVWQAMPADRLCAYTRMHVHEADGTASIDFAAHDIHAPELGHIVENSVLTGALHDGLQRLAHGSDNKTELTILAPATLDAYRHDPGVGAQLTLADGQHITASLLIAADGANSPLRAMAGFDTREWDYEHQAIVTSIKTRDAHQATARQCFMDAGVLAFLPLASSESAEDAEHYCSIVWSLLPDKAAELMAMDDAAFCQALTRASEHWLGPISDCAQRYSFPLRQRHARDYFRDAVVLVGDAAHSIHPLAGQGANLGLLDVQALAGELMRAVQVGRQLTDPMVLRRYQRRRKPHNLAMMAMMEGFKRLYADQPLAVRWLRNTGMRAVDGWPLLKNRLMREAMG
ncbi:MAG: FAD-dependent monooxygenase [Pseudohongiella sp.]|uniref:FAD-dependent monooxygenase n=1 Tax=Pseudohongiella sp. TaxID=1979412 RepID=UPI0034A01A2C